MKKLKFTLLTFLVLTLLYPSNTFSQEKVEVEKTSPFSIGTDIVTSYVWRGTKLSGPALQPYLEYSIAGFTVGSWNSFGFNDQVAEADLYASYRFDFGLSIGLTDYYVQGTPYFRYTTDSSSHAFEINLGYEINSFTISGNYITNDASKGLGNIGGDTYIELAYGFKYFNVFIGAGNGWHTLESLNTGDEFAVVNIGVSASKELKLTESFSLPISGAIVLNPQTETFNVVGTISF